MADHAPTRASVRAYVRLPVELSSAGRVWQGRTRDLSAGGTLVFVEAPYPTGVCGVVLELPGGPLRLEGEVRFTLNNVGVGLQFTGLSQQDTARLERVVDAASATFGLWGMVGKYLGDADGRLPLRPPSAQEAAFAQLRASLTLAQEGTHAGDLGDHVLHPVGENGAAYQILFTRPGAVSAAESDLCQALPGFARVTRDKVLRVAHQDVWLKLHAGATPRPYRVVELHAGGYAAVVVSELPGSPPKVSLLTLALGEQMATLVHGQPAFPHFTAQELDRMAQDGLGATPRLLPPKITGLVPLPVDLGAQRAQFSEYALYDEAQEERLALILAGDPQAEVRRYGKREVTLHPHVLLRVKEGPTGETVGVPMFDGKRFCLLQLTAEGFGRVLPLTREHQFCVLIR